MACWLFGIAIVGLLIAVIIRVDELTALIQGANEDDECAGGVEWTIGPVSEQPTPKGGA
jgi:hypothetical protein